MTMTQQEFVEDEGGKCPSCKCPDIQFKDTDYHGDCHVDLYSCPDCEAQWSAVFTLARYEWIKQPESLED